jgi:O-antigen/teichoic acid export membrane protein
VLKIPRNLLGRSSGLLPDLDFLRGGVALSDQLVASATNFLTGVIIGRVCLQEEFGLYMLGFSIVLMAIRVQSALVTSPYIVFNPRLDQKARAEYLGNILVYCLGFSGASVVSLVTVGVLLSAGYGPPGLAPVVWALAAAITVILLKELARQVCFAHLRYAAALTLDSVVAVVQLGLLGFAAVTGMLHVGVVFVIIGFACGLAAVSWLLSWRSSIAWIRGGALKNLKRNWIFGRWIVGSSLLFDAATYTYPWILTYFHGVAATGIWAACSGTVGLTYPIINGLVNLLGPEAAHAYAEGGVGGLRRVVARRTVVFTLLLSPFVAVLILFGGWIVPMLYGEKYGGHGLVVAVLALDIWLSPARIALGRALLAMERADLDFATNLVPAMCILVFGVWMTRSFGPLGVASGMLVGSLMGTAVKYAAFVFTARSDAGD